MLSKYATHENSAYPGLWRGCVGAWCPSLGPSGSRLFDYSRRQNWGTLTNMDPATDWVVSGGNYALDFDGVDDSVGFGRLSHIEGLSRLTIGMWAKWQLNASSLAAFFSYSQSGVATNDIFFFYSSGAYNIQINNGADGSKTVAASVPSQWTHYGIVFDGLATSIEFYVDGVLQSLSGAFTPPATTPGTASHSLLLGAYLAFPTGWYLSGQIDDFRVYLRKMEAGEIRTLARRRGIAFTPRTRRLAPSEQAAGGATPWLYARRPSRIIGGGVS